MKTTSSFKLLISGVMSATLLASNAQAFDDRYALEARVDQLERTISSQVGVDLLNQVNQLQEEIRTLRGTIDEQQHEIHMLNKRQEQLFGNLDARLDMLSSGNMSADATSKLKSNNAKLSAEDKEEVAYQQAYKHVTDKNTKEAEVALQEYIWKYPNGKYIANAKYWLAELYLEKWRTNKNDTLSLDKAKSAFEVVRNKYDSHQKSYDSMLKLGMIAHEQGHDAEARQKFEELIAIKPNSSTANIAKLQLKKLKR